MSINKLSEMQQHLVTLCFALMNAKFESIGDRLGESATVSVH